MTFEQLLEFAKEYQDWEEWSGELYLETLNSLASIGNDEVAREVVGGVRKRYMGRERYGGGNPRWHQLWENEDVAQEGPERPDRLR